MHHFRIILQFINRNNPERQDAHSSQDIYKAADILFVEISRFL